MKRSIIAVALAALLVLAGCAGGVSDLTGNDAATGDETAEMGQMNFYVSDEVNAMDDFEHLNVTISAVAFHKANASADDDTDATPENESEDVDDNETDIDDNETDIDDNETDIDDNETDIDDNETDIDDDENVTTTEMAESDDDGEVADKNESDDWVVQDVDSKTVDLTELKGKNATLLSQFDIPAGDYDMAMVYISNVNATLKTGEQVNVKLPSEKLQVKTPFAIGGNESVDFVFDISVHKAGGSGKYILKPVVSESGANVEKRVVDEKGEAVDDDEERELSLAVDGNLTVGEEVTVTAINDDGEPVEGAEVEVNGEVVGQTNADGQVTFTVPDAEDIEIEVESEAGDGELEVELGGDSDDADESDDADDSTESDDAPDVELAAAFTTNVTAGENATVAVTDGDGAPVEDAVVEVNGEVVGETNVDGELTFEVPSDEDDLEVVITKGDAEVELDHGVVAAAAA